MTSLPGEPGSYLLCMTLREPRAVRVGRLGPVRFESGIYLYSGSARGSGGLRARLGRHLNGSGRERWHVDYLRRVAAVAGYAYLVEEHPPEPRRIERVECAWSQALAARPGAWFPADGFGASDCPSGCRAHLVGFPLGSSLFEAWDRQTLRWLLNGLADAAGAAPEAIVFKVKWGEFEQPFRF